MKFHLVVILLISLISKNLVQAFLSQHKIKLKNLNSLTFKKGEYTKHRRVPAVPQLTCTNECGYSPNKVDCYNEGTHNGQIKWNCKAQLNKNVEFGAIKISCEGYENSQDEYILEGSCGLQYSLVHYKTTTETKLFGLEKNFKKIRQTDIKILSLKHGEITTARRTVPVQQLQCDPSGSAGCDHNVKNVKCENTESSQPIWKCITSDLPKNIKFDRVKINCEGFDNSFDEYVLEGSCGLKYSLTYNQLENFKKIRQSEIKTIYLNHGELTTARRVAPVLQLQCDRATSVDCSHSIRKVRCDNSGLSKPQWKCTSSDLTHGFQFGQIKITCEGFEYSSDEYVLEGSCGLLYSLIRSQVENPNIGFEGLETKLKKVNMAETKTLFFNHGTLTTSRRVPPVSQLQCDSVNSIDCTHLIRSVRCENSGSIQPNWKCTSTDIPHGFQFGQTKVSCEGFDSTHDIFVVEGSCWLLYSLIRSQSSGSPNIGFEGLETNFKKMHKTEMKTLIFNHASLTTARRGSPIVQLQCVNSNSVDCSYSLSNVRCENLGSYEPNWKCSSSDLPRGLEFGKTKVTCEGYDNDQDEYVLVGSCNLVYSLINSHSENNQNIPFGFDGHHKKIRKTDIKSIWLNYGTLTKARRVAPVQQIQCDPSSSEGCSYLIKSVKCDNLGGFQPSWKCTSPDLPLGYRFGYIVVGCEGYDNPNDEYVLEGSCGFKYKLEVDPFFNNQNYGNTNQNNLNSNLSAGAIAAIVLGGFFVFAIIITIICVVCVFKK